MQIRSINTLCERITHGRQMLSVLLHADPSFFASPPPPSSAPSAQPAGEGAETACETAGDGTGDSRETACETASASRIFTVGETASRGAASEAREEAKGGRVDGGPRAAR